MYEHYHEELDALREQYGADAVNDIITRPELLLGEDYTAHKQELQVQLDAIREELGEEEAE